MTQSENGYNGWVGELSILTGSPAPQACTAATSPARWANSPRSKGLMWHGALAGSATVRRHFSLSGDRSSPKTPARRSFFQLRTVSVLLEISMKPKRQSGKYWDIGCDYRGKRGSALWKFSIQ